MAVQQNPYQYWSDERSESDYRDRTTQAMSLTRQMLRQPEYLLRSNRVNPGPGRNTRARAADLSSQSPHNALNEDVWGWQRWTEKGYYLVDSEISNNLLEESGIGTGMIPESQVPFTPVERPVVIIPGSQEAKSFMFNQIEPLQVWTVIHDLGFYPSVELFDSTWKEIDGDITHLSKNTLKVEFTIPVSGHARLV